MKRKTWSKRLKIAIIVLSVPVALFTAVVAAICLGAAISVAVGPEREYSGFNNDIVERFDSRGVSIPENAAFVGGNTFYSKDPVTTVAFDVKLDELNGYKHGMKAKDVLRLLTGGDEIFAHRGGVCNQKALDEASEKYGRKYTDYLEYKNDDFSYVMFSEIAGNTISLCFVFG